MVESTKLSLNIISEIIYNVLFCSGPFFVSIFQQRIMLNALDVLCITIVQFDINYLLDIHVGTYVVRII